MNILIAYLVCMLLGWLPLRAAFLHYERRGNNRAQWALVGLGFLLLVAHWAWVSSLRGTL